VLCLHFEQKQRHYRKRYYLLPANLAQADQKRGLGHLLSKTASRSLTGPNQSSVAESWVLGQLDVVMIVAMSHVVSYKHSWILGWPEFTSL
jgi:hypothetical protein